MIHLHSPLNQLRESKQLTDPRITLTPRNTTIHRIFPRHQVSKEVLRIPPPILHLHTRPQIQLHHLPPRRQPPLLLPPKTTRIRLRRRRYHRPLNPKRINQLLRILRTRHIPVRQTRHPHLPTNIRYHRQLLPNRLLPRPHRRRPAMDRQPRNPRRAEPAHQRFGLLPRLQKADLDANPYLELRGDVSHQRL